MSIFKILNSQVKDEINVDAYWWRFSQMQWYGHLLAYAVGLSLLLLMMTDSKLKTSAVQYIIQVEHDKSAQSFIFLPVKRDFTTQDKPCVFPPMFQLLPVVTMTVNRQRWQQPPARPDHRKCLCVIFCFTSLSASELCLVMGNNYGNKKRQHFQTSLLMFSQP